MFEEYQIRVCSEACDFGHEDHMSCFGAVGPRVAGLPDPHSTQGVRPSGLRDSQADVVPFNENRKNSDLKAL